MAADGDLGKGTCSSKTVENDTYTEGLRRNQAYEMTRHRPHRTTEQTRGLTAEHKGLPESGHPGQTGLSATHGPGPLTSF